MNRFEKPNLKKRILDSVSLPVITFIVILALFLYGISAISGTAAGEQVK